MERHHTPHVFSACSTSRALSCDTADFFADCPQAGPGYAQVHIHPQAYTNCMCPAKSLSRGTMFRDLYMPYAPVCPRRRCCHEHD